MSILNRRQLLGASLAGAGLVGLRAMATGLPISFLLNPKSVRADDACAAGAQFLILSMSANGDALNCNVPGTYDLPATFAAGTVNHADPTDMSMTATQLTIGGKKWTAAKPWSTLPQDILDRTVFFHHSTGTANHGELGRVLELFGSLRRGQWLPSYFAKTMRSCFNTVQSAAGDHRRRAAVVRGPVPAQAHAHGSQGRAVGAEGSGGQRCKACATTR